MSDSGRAAPERSAAGPLQPAAAQHADRAGGIRRHFRRADRCVTRCLGTPARLDRVDLLGRLGFNALDTNTDGDVAAIAASYGNPGFEHDVELPPPQVGIRVRRTARDS